MRISCTIDYNHFSLDLNSQMPLSVLIKEVFAKDLNYNFFSCKGGRCLKCLVYIDDWGVLPSCMIPVFKIDGKTILTPEAYLNTSMAIDVIQAMNNVQCFPCENCYKSKVMLFGYIVEKLIERENIVKTEGDFSGDEPKIREDIINSILNMSSCSCMLKSDMFSVVDEVIRIRREKVV